MEGAFELGMEGLSSSSVSHGGGRTVVCKRVRVVIGIFTPEFVLSLLNDKFLLITMRLQNYRGWN
jgi:hypothetical protein